MALIADRYLYTDSQKLEALEEEDPRCGFLLAHPGMLIPDDDVARYGLTATEDGKILTPAQRAAAAQSSTQSDSPDPIDTAEYILNVLGGDQVVPSNGDVPVIADQSEAPPAEPAATEPASVPDSAPSPDPEADGPEADGLESAVSPAPADPTPAEPTPTGKSSRKN